MRKWKQKLARSSRVYYGCAILKKRVPSTVEGRLMYLNSRHI
jgi:hypothetical protein